VTTARVQDGRVAAVRFRNVPAFVAERDLEAGGMEMDVAFGGAFYASVEAPFAVEISNVPKFIKHGREIKRELEAAREFVHPEEPELRDIYGVIFWQDEGRERSRLVQRNVTVFADGEVDRSPCGSGTSARLALLDSDEELLHRSVIGTEFLARIVERTEVAGIPAVVTEVEGSAHYTGRHEFVADPADPLGPGFLLR
jgi:proline racemase